MCLLFPSMPIIIGLAKMWSALGLAYAFHELMVPYRPRIRPILQ